MSSKTQINRRDFLRLAAFSAAGVALSSLTSSEGLAESTTQMPVQPDQSLGELPLQEPPVLAEQVQAGVLPPLDQRLPTNPLVLTPLNRVGRHGGRMRLQHSWLAGFTLEMMYGHSPIKWIDDGLALTAGLCESWSTNANNTEWTLNFRQGLKWSDGASCTTADVMYWWQDLVLNPAHNDPVPDFGRAGGLLATFTAVDAYTLKITYAVPAPLTAKRLACWVNGSIGERWIAPRHYLMQYHPTYNPSYTDFVVHDQMMDLRTNPQSPTLNAWILAEYVDGVSARWERNPYYYAVDTQGQQLPYIDGLDELAQYDHDPFMNGLTQGEVHFNCFTYILALTDIPALQAAQTQGNYDVRLLDGGSGTGECYYWNFDHPEERRRNLFRNPSFKRAMSLALNRASIRTAVCSGYGDITTGSISPKAIEFNYNQEARDKYAEIRDAYSAFNPAQAMALLDAINVVDVNADGWREFPDGTPLVLSIDYPNDISGMTRSTLDITEQNWMSIGLNVVRNELDPNTFLDLWRLGQLQVRAGWEVSDGPDHLIFVPWVVPTETERWAPLCGRTYMLRGTPDEDTQCVIDPWARIPPRYCSTDPQYLGSTALQLQQMYDQAVLETDAMTRMEMVWDMVDLHIDPGPFFIGTVCNLPRIVIVSQSLENVPTRDQLALGGFLNPWIVPYPAIINPETFFFKHVVFVPMVTK
jgi:peptide/nickel transport system substrate-binding protein